MTDGIDISQLRAQVVRPTLAALGLGGAAAEELLIGTILQESQGGHWLRQLGPGPAIGICQMEPATHDDLWTHYLDDRPMLAGRVRSLRIGVGNGIGQADEMAGNLYYAIAMARVLYARVPDPLPPAGDVAAQAAYYKTHYNTAGGAATVGQYIAHWQRAFC
jgi:hypothetical protein